MAFRPFNVNERIELRKLIDLNFPFSVFCVTKQSKHKELHARADGVSYPIARRPPATIESIESIKSIHFPFSLIIIITMTIAIICRSICLMKIQRNVNKVLAYIATPVSYATAWTQQRYHAGDDSNRAPLAPFAFPHPSTPHLSTTLMAQCAMRATVLH